MYERFGLPNPNCFDEDDVVASSFAKCNGLSGMLGYTTEGAAGSAGSDKHIEFLREAFHSGFVAEDAATRTRRRWING